MSTISDLEMTAPRNNSKRGEPAWDIALLFPRQGQWTEDEYLALDTNRMIELSNGYLEFLPMPTFLHQLIVRQLVKVLDAFVEAGVLGWVLTAPLPVRLWSGKLCEPDIVFLRPRRIRNPKRPPHGADLVMEVVSKGAENRKRDLVTKRSEYARALIDEYWIVDPEKEFITVLRRAGKKYRVHGEFGPGSSATSSLLAGFQLDVADVFAVGMSAAKATTRVKSNGKNNRSPKEAP
jgi:Uma2 family endonuclease